MKTVQEYIEAAESDLDTATGDRGPELAGFYLARAQTNATLALVAATYDNTRAIYNTGPV